MSSKNLTIPVASGLGSAGAGAASVYAYQSNTSNNGDLKVIPLQEIKEEVKLPKVLCTKNMFNSAVDSMKTFTPYQTTPKRSFDFSNEGFDPEDACVKIFWIEGDDKAKADERVLSMDIHTYAQDSLNAKGLYVFTRVKSDAPIDTTSSLEKVKLSVEHKVAYLSKNGNDWSVNKGFVWKDEIFIDGKKFTLKMGLTSGKTSSSLEIDNMCKPTTSSGCSLNSFKQQSKWYIEWEQKKDNGDNLKDAIVSPELSDLFFVGKKWEEEDKNKVTAVGSGAPNSWLKIATDGPSISKMPGVFGDASVGIFLKTARCNGENEFACSL